MLTKRDLLRSGALATVAVVGTKPAPALAQMLTGAPTEPNLKYSTERPPGVAAPDTVETRLGTLNFFDGFPDKASAERLFDNLDFQRAVQAFLFAVPAVSQVANRAAFRALGPPNTVVPIFDTTKLDFVFTRPRNCWTRGALSSPAMTTRSIAGRGWTLRRVRSFSKCPRKCSAPSTTCGSFGSKR